jgi:predicted transcriptional regulator
MTSHAENRRTRIQRIAATMRERKDTLDLEKLIAVCCIEWGCTEKTIREYIEMVKKAGLDK